MYRIVKIGDKEVPMLSMASVDIYYRNIFHEDPIKLQSSKDFDEGDLINFMMKMGFVMAKFAEVKDRKEMKNINEDMFLEWLDQFGRGDYLNALVDIRLVYDEQSATSSESKKNTDQPSE